MSDAPERIWAWRWDLPYPSKCNGKREWGTAMYPSEQAVTAYVRSDLHYAQIAALQAERDAALSQVERMREALEFYAPKEINGIKFSGGDDNGNRARRALTPEEPTP